MDLILINGRIHTMDLSNPIAEAVAIKEDKIFKVGHNDEILFTKDENTIVVDLKGKVVVPGFNDSHMHLLGFGYFLNMVDLSNCRSIDEIIEKTKEYIKEKNIKEGKWVRGRGWNHDYFEAEKRFPSRYDLDKISTEHPIVLTRACGHICVANSKAIEMAGLNRETQQVEGGHFDVDESGELLGIFRENALDLIYSIIPSPKHDEIKKAIKDAMVYANSKGLTSVQTDDFGNIPGYDFKEVIKVYNELKESGELTLRVYEQCLLPEIRLLNEFIEAGYGTGHGDEMFKIGPLKLLGDGSLGARTAALCQPYADEPSTKGILVFTQEELDELVKTAHNNKMQVAIHAIGDKIMYMALESIEKALMESPRLNHRHGIVHCQITDEALLNKYSELNVIAYIQPIFLHYDIHIVEERLGKEKAKETYAFKSMLDKNINIALGTDCPVEPLDVMPSIYCAVTRKDLKGYPEKGWLPEEKLTVEEAIYNYTMGSAYASFEDNIKGSITEGKLADMVVLSQDIFEVELDTIKDIEVDMTILGGKIVYNS
ncbi:amidohydrolase [Proteiniborus sp.]|uniref:amidohydrolase n=1 Tax=Proteiniborus sp. TaxID=2079015 RepID=UPI00331B365F